MKPVVIVLAALVALAACGSRTRTPALDAEVIVVNGPATPAAKAASSRTLHIVIPSRNVSATLAPAGRNGTVGTWQSLDHVSFSYDRGVLVATRGLGFDLMGANAGQTLDALAGRDAGVYRRRMRYLDGENHTFYVTAGCSMEIVGAERVGGQRLVRHRESCRAIRGEFTNVYWTDQRGTVRRSREWVGPEVGYVEAQR